MRIEASRNPLRRARLAARLELRDLAERTRISPAMLRYMDEGQFDRLPAGIYARAWVKAVAEALSLDAQAVLGELEGVLPKAAPIETLVNPPEGPDPAREAQVRWGSSLVIPADRWRRAAAAALDGMALALVTIGVWLVTAAASGSSPSGVGQAAAVGISATALALALVYFIVFAGIGGRTPGAALMGFAAETEPGPLGLTRIGRRALHAALSEASILVEILMPFGPGAAFVRSAFRRT